MPEEFSQHSYEGCAASVFLYLNHFIILLQLLANLNTF